MGDRNLVIIVEAPDDISRRVLGVFVRLCSLVPTLCGDEIARADGRVCKHLVQVDVVSDPGEYPTTAHYALRIQVPERKGYRNRTMVVEGRIIASCVVQLSQKASDQLVEMAARDWLAYLERQLNPPAA